MALKTRAALKAEAVIIRDETTQNANTATRVGGTTYDLADSATLRPLTLGALTPSAMVFDENGFYSQYTQSGAVTFNITGTPTDGISQVIDFVSDGSNTISFNSSKFDIVAGLYGITNGGTLAAGLWRFFLLCINGKVSVNVPATAAGDITPPTITSGTFASDNSYIDVLFSEGVYGAGGVAAVLADFDITFAQAGGTATAWTASSVKQNDSAVEGSASALAGGETTIRIFGAATGTPDGNETLEVTPADGASLYDVYGNAMLAAQTTGAVSLNAVSSYTFANTHELVVDASGEGVLITENSLWPTGDFSLEIWIETPSSMSGSRSYILLDDTDGSAFFGFIFDMQDDSGQKARLRCFTDGSNSISRQTTTTISTSTLYHIIYTYDSTTEAINVYLDGSDNGNTQSEAGTFTGIPARVGAVTLDIGNSQGGTIGTGNYQIVRVFNEELTSGEVTTLYNGGTPVGLNASLQAKCIQENLLNNTPNADNIGTNGTDQGTVTYQAV